MKIRSTHSDDVEAGEGPSASTGVLFAIGCLGFFYSFIAMIDPLL